MSKTIYLDTETTGLNQSINDVLEISIIDDQGIILLDTLCSPTKNTTWPEAQRIHGITPAMLEGKPTLMQLLPTILEIFDVTDEIVIYNAAYDYPFLINAAQGNAYDKLRGHHTKVRCAMLEYARHIGAWNDYRNDYRWHKLTEAAANVGHTWQGTAHRALADTQATRSVWHWLRDRKQKRGVAKSLTHADLASIDLDTVLDSLEESAAERGVDGYLSNLTWTQRENLQSTLNKCLIDWLNTNLPR